MAKLELRAPVVVVLGHVDHGKTTLLDYIRKTKVAEQEVGEITQSIGAYEVLTKIKEYKTEKITFIDTPGHEAFTKLRSRGADVADMAILVIDAVDSVMPQTVESIYHIREAKIPFLVAINKIDLPRANEEKVKRDLAKEKIQVEGMGGDVPVVSISAKKGKGIGELLETILFVAAYQELKYSAENPLEAYIIESKKDRRGVVASVVIKDGKLEVGETVYADSEKARVRAIINDKGKSLRQVLPSTPFLLLGFKKLPQVGVPLTKEPVKKEEKKKPAKKETGLAEMLQAGEEEKEKLRLIIKADSQGSLEAVMSSLEKGENIEIVLASIGEITKSDIFLAKVSKAIIVGFSVSIDKRIRQFADQEKVVIKSYSLIYKLVEALTKVSRLILEQDEREKSAKGEAKIIARFIIEKEKVAGVKVLKGKINLEDEIELQRDGKLIGKAKIVSLKQRAKSIKEVKKNEEAGMIFYPQLDFSIGDVIKSYSI